MIIIKKKYLVQYIFLILIFGFIILVNTFVSAKYIIQKEFCVASLNIDRTKPYIELVNINNTNIGYEGYANNTHIITINVKIVEKNIENLYFDKEHVKVKIENNYISSDKITLTKIGDRDNGQMYQIKLNNIEGNGKLKVEILEGTVIDAGKMVNDFYEIDSKIIIDNIAPKGLFLEEKASGGKVNGIISLNEKIRELEGWSISEDKLKIKKEFTNNISYELPVIDYAGNKSIINIDITKATFINIIYASHNSQVGWTFGYGNYDIAGKEAVNKNPIYKTEVLAFNISGNIETDFVQAKTYIYTHWGDSSLGKCTSSGLLYKNGYNPSDTTYKSMNSTDLVMIQNKKYFQFGGAGINGDGIKDANGNNPIPNDAAAEYRYGICGIEFKLKEYSQFSIVYQIYVDNTGWVKACSDGEECLYSKVSPISAFRVALIPESEKQHVLDTWNKDIGTSNMK